MLSRAKWNDIYKEYPDVGRSMTIEIDGAKIHREKDPVTGEVINRAEKTPDIAAALIERHVPVSTVAASVVGPP
jgi:hypothetical protein